MLFQTPLFFGFFSLFCLFYFFSRKSLPLQNFVVLAASYIFYAAWDERFLTLIIASTAVDYLAGIGASGRSLSTKTLLKASAYLLLGSLISLGPTLSESYQYFPYIFMLAIAFWLLGAVEKRLNEATRKKVFVIFSLFVNLGLLGVFKYFNFFADSLDSLVSTFGYQLNYVTIEIVLPVGISFYTFQTLSYSIDAYRGKLKPTDNLLQLAAFVAFFPQLVAGPVERAASLLPQFQRPRVYLKEDLKTGATLFIWGMFKKVFIADNLAPIADHAFANAGTLSSFELFLGLLAFTFQIYCDFSGYSDMARGSARILGFKLMLNFNLPYISRTPSEFWQRWHISLSSWLRDYLYISLGGNKLGPLITYRNLFLTMLLGGLWHGASWTFILWGAFHGGILIIYRILAVDNLLAAATTNSKLLYQRCLNLSSIAVMFGLTLVGWMIFRANTMEVLASYSKNMFSFSGGIDWAGLANIAYYVWPLLLVQFIQIRKGNLEVFWGLPAFARLNIALFVILCIVFLQPATTAAFIYFDF